MSERGQPGRAGWTTHGILVTSRLSGVEIDHLADGRVDLLSCGSHAFGRSIKELHHSLALVVGDAQESGSHGKLYLPHLLGGIETGYGCDGRHRAHLSLSLSENNSHTFSLQ